MEYSLHVVIDELNDGAPHPIPSVEDNKKRPQDQGLNIIPDRGGIIRKIESLSDTKNNYNSGVYLGKIEKAMKEALKKKNIHPQPKELEPGIIIMRRRFSRLPMEGVYMNFDFDVRSYKPYSLSYIEEVADSLPIVWRRVDARGSTYKPLPRDIGKRLKLECFLQVEGKNFLANVTVTNKVVEYSSDLYRGWRSRGGRGDDAGTFNVLSYNILADLHHFNPYMSCYRVWKYRRKALLSELKHYNVDILCLQEVQDNHFAEFLAPKLERLGYLVVYKTKNHTVDYEKEANLKLEDRNENHVLRKELVKNLNNIFPSNFKVNTLLTKLKDFTKSKKIPLIICGDFNSFPTSRPYKLLVEGRLSSELVRQIDKTRICIGKLLKVEEILEPPSIAELPPLPRPDEPTDTDRVKGVSDHIALAARFKFK
ncbi:Endonuclease/exonuclease/phosphatase [Corchorus olitorius]|uniref:Endonuclease/exonuclease/phosphatase n=1 Tax=Corchorus olitorius TaxID=93759 RepID=A0A1R3JUE7_9ROSI|nr:Endonuclease/exonuclease/phosphatase [Corchorus olitorius]